MEEVEAFLAQLPADQRAELEKIRTIVKQTVPAATETISYQIPAFMYQGQPLLYYAAFKDHYSLFPTAGPIEILKDKLKSYRITRGTIHFTAAKPLPRAL